ncbi:DUF1499 domain-containing protein [Vibrio sp. HN007]|uniref:DUF1499 domain-containing protein n=1 Tax=Vibrio iocasae TaxID=3098914 RepID=UPI0035D43AE6
MILKIISAVIALGVGFMVYKNSAQPDYLGVVDGKFAPVPSSPNAVSTQSDDPEKLVAPLSFDDITHAKKSVYNVLTTMGGNEIVTDDEFYMHVVFTTPTMKYRDDLELYFNIDEKQIEYRSQSRVGYSDRGLNRERYDSFVKLYKESK